MNGGADLGGMMGFGPVVQEEDEPLFHAPWEARALGIVVALGACGQWNIDAARSAREDMHPGDYTRTPYYAIWLKAAKRLMVEKGMLTEAEIAQSVPLTPAAPIKRKLAAEDVDAMLAAGGPADRPATGTPAFAVGDQIRTINNHPTTHTSETVTGREVREPTQRSRPDRVVAKRERTNQTEAPSENE